MSLRNLTRPVALGAAALAIAGGAYGIVNAAATNNSGSVTSAPPAAAVTAHRPPGARGSNARSGPAAGGTAGTIESVSKSSFTVLTPAGQKVTIETTSSTRYQSGGHSIPPGALAAGAPVLILGTTNGTTITASEIEAGAAPASGSSTSSASGVVPFQRGAPSTSKQVGQIPTGYSQGSGTIVSGATADAATRAALGAYPGGIVDRVVRLSNGEYEVHNIGVNWPHHVFVNQSYQVLGAN